MPIYEYTCQACHKKFEHLARTMNDHAKVKCPECGSKKIVRDLSVFAVGAESKPAPRSGGCGNCSENGCPYAGQD